MAASGLPFEAGRFETIAGDDFYSEMFLAIEHADKTFEPYDLSGWTDWKSEVKTGTDHYFPLSVDVDNAEGKLTISLTHTQTAEMCAQGEFDIQAREIASGKIQTWVHGFIIVKESITR